MALGLALGIIRVGHADWVVEQKAVIVVTEVDTTVLTLAFVDLVPGGILIFVRF